MKTSLKSLHVVDECFHPRSSLQVLYSRALEFVLARSFHQGPCSQKLWGIILKKMLGERRRLEPAVSLEYFTILTAGRRSKLAQKLVLTNPAGEKKDKM